jgi:uncharacterized protein (TIGR03437 family)
MKTNPIRAIVLCASFAGLSTVSAQTLSYSLLPAGPISPSTRFDGTIAYDSSGKQIFLFGGQDTTPRNDLWVYSLQLKQWASVQVAGAAGGTPPARFGHTLIFDPVRKRLVLFGGQAGTFYSDTWAFDIAGGTWQQLSPDGAGPSRRYGHSAIYETARDRMVISHGFTDAGRFDDTWAFDLKTNSWTNLSPPDNRPLRRCLHHAAYDPASSRMYLYGGCSSGYGPCPQGDLWAFDLNRNQWTQLASSASSGSPPAREHYGMAFDIARGRLQVFGGEGSALLNDTWDYIPSTDTWEQTPLNGPPPSPRQRHEAAYAVDSGATFFFGGMTADGLSNQLWMLSPAAASAGPQVSITMVENAFNYRQGAVAPGELVSIFGSGLGPANGMSFAFDPVTGALPVSGAGVAVAWNGIPAPLYFARADQLNVQVPYELDGASQANLVVTVNGTASSPMTIPVASAAPGLAAAAFQADFSPISPSNPATAGSIIVLWATGQGVTSPPSRTGAYPTNGFPVPSLSVVLQLGGLPAQILFDGQAPGATGVMQINARVPSGIAPGDQVPVVLSIGDYASPPIMIAVR